MQKYKIFSLFVFLFLSIPIHAKSSTCRVVATIDVGENPSAIAITPDGKTAYVANNNNASVAGGDTVSVIDLCTNTVITTISDASFDEPYTVTINADGTRVYITNSNGTTVSIIDTSTNTVIGTITGFDGPSGFAITPDGKTAYVNNYGGPSGVGSGNATTVRVVDLTTNAIVGSAITVGLAPAALAVTPDGAFVYVINYETGNPGTGTISIIQTSTNTVVGTIKGFSGPYAIAITPDGSYAYVTNFGSNNFSPISGGMSLNVSGITVSAVNLKTNSIKATITLGNQPSGVAITPDGRFAYVSNYNTFYLGANFTDLTPGKAIVNVIDICTNKVLCPEIEVGASPAAVAISPDGCFAYTANYSANSISVININDQMWLNPCN